MGAQRPAENALRRGPGWTHVTVFLSAVIFSNLSHGQPPQDAATPGAALPVPSSSEPGYGDVAVILEQFCVTCHSGDEPEADLSLHFRDQQEAEALAREDRDLWQRLVAALRSGYMPPEDLPKPDDHQRELLVTWVERDLLGVDCASPRDAGRVTTRRLNRTEYNNTIRDLLYLDDFHGADQFPADDRGYGFDNNGELLSLSPAMIEQYLETADRALQQAFDNPEARSKLTRSAADHQEDFSSFQAKVRLVIEEFTPRAWRRPVRGDEIDRLMEFAALSFAHDGESTERAMMLTMRAALLSPEFLFRIERASDAESGDDQAIALSEFELASRLSYFLWASMPDEELFRLARAQQLRANLDAQVRRMLKDPKASALTESFAGQWLEIRGLDDVQRDPERFPTFTPQLRSAMKRETELFFECIVKEDRSIMEFLDADFTFLNETLARHYGIENIEGEEFRRVALDPSQRGGLLTQASVLTLTSNPTRTSPVKRGKWILENLLNTPPPPPPPDVPSLEGDGKPLTGSLREVLEQHRADPNCITCHQLMDPYGLALENYDAIGAWRTHENDVEIDASGAVSSGETFAGPRELRQIVASKQKQFRRALVSKMLIYALGRGLEYYDKCTIDDICARLEDDEDRFSALIQGIVHSVPFQNRPPIAGAE